MERNRVMLRAEIERAERRLADLARREEKGAVTTEAAARAEEAKAMDAYTRLRQDPELQALRLAAESGKLATRYGPLFRALGLSPEQAERFLKNVIAREEAKSDLEAANSVRGLEHDDEVAMRLRGKVQQDYEDAQRALLGDAGLRAAADYEAALPVRETVRGLAAAATIAGEPMTPQQAEQLTQCIVAAAPPLQNGLDTDGIDWARVDAQASGMLSAGQLGLLQSVEAGWATRFSGKLQRAVDAARKVDAERKR